MRKYGSRMGFALPAALGVLAILMVLGTTLWQVGMADGIQSNRMESKVQASYIARSGVESMSEYLIDHYPADPELLDSLLDQRSDPVTLGNGDFTVELYENPDGLLVLESVGTVKGVSHIARMALNETGVLGDVAMYGNRIEINGRPLVKNDSPDGPVTYGDGGLHAGSGDPMERFTNPDGVSYEQIDFPDPEFPPPDIDWVHDYYPQQFTGGSISENTIYGSVKLAGAKSSMDVSLGEDGDVYLLADEFDASGIPPSKSSISVSGEGVFYIYVKDSFDAGGNFKSDTNWDENHIVIMMASDGTIDLTGTSDFKGIVYAPNAELILRGTSMFTGQAIADTITISGTGSTTHAFEYHRLHADGEGVPKMLKKGKWLQ